MSYLGYMRTITLYLLLATIISCRTPQPETPSAIAEPPAQKGLAADEGQVAAWRGQLDDIALPDSLRLAAAGQLQHAAPKILAASWSLRDNARIIRQLIELAIAAEDERVLPLLLALFERVGGEERIDFEHDILKFGRRSEGRMLELLHAQERGLVMRAVDALAKMQSSVASDSIALLLQHPEPWLRISAAHALGEIGAERSVEPLLGALRDTVYSVVNAALVGLGRLKAVAAYDQVVALSQSDNNHVRKHAAIALGELADRRALAIVRALAAEDPDSGVRFMAGKAAAKLEQIP